MPLPATSHQSALVPPEEYLRLERQAEGRSEYWGGKIVAMSGASRSHNRIVFSVSGSLYAHIRGGDCEGYTADMKVRLVGSVRYVYPDVVVVGGDPIFEDERTDIVTNPTLIVEVLSDSTETVDRGAKWDGYQRMPSLREYVLIAQDRASVEQFVRHGDLWIYSRSEGLDAVATLNGVGLALPLATIYEGVATTAGDEIAP